MKKRLIAVLLVLLLCAGSAAAEVLPRAGIDQGWKEYTGQSCVTGVILCDSLTLRAKPSASSKALYTLENKFTRTYKSSSLRILSEPKDGWVEVQYSDLIDGHGYLRAEYVLIDPLWYRAGKETAVYAYGDASAPRVGLLSKGTVLPIIAERDGWYVVSMPAGSGWIRK